MAKKKTVMMIIPKFCLAGAEIMCENLLNSINNKEFNLIVISLFNYKSSITKRLENNNITIVYLNKRKGLDLSIFFKLQKVIKKYKPEIIHTHLYVLEYLIPLLLISNNRKRKLIHTMHHPAHKDPKHLILLHKLYIKIGGIIVAISEEIQESLVSVYKKDKSHFPVVYNGIDLDKCIKKTNYNKFNKIIHIGRFEEVKNHKLLIDCFEQFINETNCNVQLELIGEGSLEESIKEYTEKKEISKKVIFMGSMSECYQELAQADAFILTSKSEGMPMTIIEAMGTGLPIIACNVGGIKNMIIDGKDGLLAEKKEEYVESLKSIYHNKEYRKQLGENAKNKSKIFSAKIMTDKYEELYKKGKGE